MSYASGWSDSFFHLRFRSFLMILIVCAASSVSKKPRSEKIVNLSRDTVDETQSTCCVGEIHVLARRFHGSRFDRPDGLCPNAHSFSSRMLGWADAARRLVVQVVVVRD